MQEANSFTALHTPQRETHTPQLVDISLEPFPWVWLSGQSAAAKGCVFIVGQSQRLHSQDLDRCRMQKRILLFCCCPSHSAGKQLQAA